MPRGSENFDVFLELDGSNDVQVRRIFGSGFDNLVARQDDLGTVNWYGTDRQGTVLQVFDNSGNETHAAEYDAFGVIQSGTLIDRYGFHGREHDALTGLRHHRAREFNGQFWTSEDPIGFAAGDSNLRRFVGNGPGNATDPSGMDFIIRPEAMNPPAPQPTVPTNPPPVDFTPVPPTPPANPNPAPGDPPPLTLIPDSRAVNPGMPTPPLEIIETVAALPETRYHPIFFWQLYGLEEARWEEFWCRPEPPNSQQDVYVMGGVPTIRIFGVGLIILSGGLVAGGYIGVGAGTATSGTTSTIGRVATSRGATVAGGSGAGVGGATASRGAGNSGGARGGTGMPSSGPRNGTNSSGNGTGGSSPNGGNNTGGTSTVAPNNPASNAAPRHGPRGVDPAHHNANIIVRDSSGNIRHHERIVSGNMTPAENALRFPRNSLASHTEARAIRNIPLQRGETMTITGQRPPCPTCKGAMNKAAKDSGATIIYRWRQNGVTCTWKAGN